MQRCIDSEEIEAEARISDITASANLSRLPYESKYAGLQEPGSGPVLPRLVITVVETAEMDPAKVFEVSPAGLKGSQRFGSGAVLAGSAENSDIQLPSHERGIGAHHFQVEFNPRKQVYALKDLGEGTGTFIRLDLPHYVTRPCIVSFSDSHVKVSLQDEVQSPTIDLAFIEGPKKDEHLYCLPSSFTPEHSPVKIGRMAGAAVRFEEGSLSRCQCSLEFSQEKGWCVKDGDGVKMSTNGTWLFAEEACDLHSGTIFKAGQTLFKVVPTQATLELQESESGKDCD